MAADKKNGGSNFRKLHSGSSGEERRGIKNADMNKKIGKLIDYAMQFNKIIFDHGNLLFVVVDKF